MEVNKVSQSIISQVAGGFYVMLMNSIQYNEIMSNKHQKKVVFIDISSAGYYILTVVIKCTPWIHSTIYHMAALDVGLRI